MVTDPEASPMGNAERDRPQTRVRCPNCGEHTAWHSNPHRPFCSLRCRLIDLGLWLDERYRIEADTGPDGGHDDVS